MTDVLTTKPALYSWYQDVQLPGNKLSNYNLVKQIGVGGSAQVWLAQPVMGLKTNQENTYVAIKQIQLRQNRPDDSNSTSFQVLPFQKEVKILLNLKQDTTGHHIVCILDWFVDPIEEFGYIVLEYIAHCADPLSIYNTWTMQEIKFYFYQLLQAVRQSHNNAVMHGDIKPKNILIDEIKQRLVLTDFGHAQIYSPNMDLSIGIGTVCYRSPELLLGYTKYTLAIDLWSAGCVFLLMLFPYCHHFLFERSHSNETQLLIWINKFGKVKVNQLHQKWFNNIDFIDCTSNQLNELSWKDFLQSYLIVDSSYQESSVLQERYTEYLIQQPLALDLLSQLLAFDPSRRPNIEQALCHPFFSH